MNSVVALVSDVPTRKVDLLANRLSQHAIKSVELGPAFTEVLAGNPNRGKSLARAYARSLPTIDDHRQLFRNVAVMKPRERRVLLEGYRAEGHGRGVVHATSQLPRAQARVVMHDFITKPDGSLDKRCLQEVGSWLRDAGTELRKAEGNGVVPLPDTDEPIGDLFEDIADAISDAVTAVVDAIADIAGAFVELVSDIVNWAIEEIASLARALLEAFETIGAVIVEVAQAGYAVLRKVIEGLENIGTAMFAILDAAIDLAADVVVMVLRAIDNLGRQLAEFLQWMANKALDFVTKAISALLEIGKSIGNILLQAAEFGLTLIRNSVAALLALGKAAGEILVTLVTRPQHLLRQVVQSFTELGRTVVSLVEEIKNHGAELIGRVAQAAGDIASSLVDLVVYAAGQVIEIAAAVVDGLLDAGRTIAQLIVSVAQAGVAAGLVRLALVAGYDRTESSARLVARLLKDEDVAADGPLLQSDEPVCGTACDGVVHAITQLTGNGACVDQPLPSD